MPPKHLCIVQYELEESSSFTKQVGDKWVHAKDVCKQEQCSYGPNGNAQVISIQEQCITDCAPGYSYKKLDPSKCCGECVQTSCIFEDKLYDVDALWSSPDNCTHYMCLKKDKVLMVSSSVEVCPDVSRCAPHNIYVEGCCKHCKLEPIIESHSEC